MRFRTTILQGHKTATGIEVPEDVVTALGSGKRAKVGRHDQRLHVSQQRRPDGWCLHDRCQRRRPAGGRRRRR